MNLDSRQANDLLAGRTSLPWLIGAGLGLMVLLWVGMKVIRLAFRLASFVALVLAVWGAVNYFLRRDEEADDPE